MQFSASSRQPAQTPPEAVLSTFVPQRDVGSLPLNGYKVLGFDLIGGGILKGGEKFTDTNVGLFE